MKDYFVNKYEYDEYVQAELEHVNLFPIPPIKMIQIGVLITGLGILALINGSGMMGGNDIVLLVVGIVILLWGLVPTIDNKNTFKADRKLKPEEKIETTIRFGEKILFKQGTEVNMFEYADIKKVAISNSLYILVTKDDYWIVLKKGCFETGDETKLVGFLKRKCPI